MDRDQFRRAILDDPVNRQAGRVVAYHVEDWGHFEQIGPLIRCGPEPAGRPRLMLPGIGEHSVEVLEHLGFGKEEIDALVDAKVVA
jgi:crotonobetainyl-CoA:carnitine CoA-transferase CaiB-like acyl-CoA transferase